MEAQQKPTVAGGYDFASYPEPDYRSLFKMYMAEHSDVLDSAAMAMEYHYAFHLEPTTSTRRYKSSPECRQISKLWKNEFDRMELTERVRPAFTKALADVSGWPKTAIFRIEGENTLQQYAFERHEFPGFQLTGDWQGIGSEIIVGRNHINGKSLCRGPYPADGKGMLPRDGHGNTAFRFVFSGGGEIATLPMKPTQARAYLKKHTNRKVAIDALVEVGPIPFGRAMRKDGIAARIIAVRVLDPEDGKVLHSYDPSLFELQVEETATGTQEPTHLASDNAVPMTNYLLALMTLRDHPQLLDNDEMLLKLLSHHIYYEQQLWERIDKYLEKDQGRRNLNRKRPAFIYEWQTLEKENPQLANGPVLDVFVHPESSWDFVRKEPEWDDRFEAVVEVFLFARDQIEGRDQDFAAKELLPVWKRHLTAASARLPRRLLMSTQIYVLPYDFDTKSFLLVPIYKVAGTSREREAAKDLIDLFMPITDPGGAADPPKQLQVGYATIVLPESARACCLYAIPGDLSKRAATPRLGLRVASSGEHPSVRWREMLLNFAGSTFLVPQIWVLVDHRLALSSIPASPSEAEQLMKNIREGERSSHGIPLEARMTFEPVRIDLGKRVGRAGSETPSPILFGRLVGVDLRTQSGEVIASYSPDDFPTAELAHAAAAAARLAKEQRTEEAEAKAAATAKNIREGIEARFEQCAAIADLKERGRCLEAILRDRKELKLNSNDLVKLGKMQLLIRIEQASAKQLEKTRRMLEKSEKESKAKQERR